MSCCLAVWCADRYSACFMAASHPHTPVPALVHSASSEPSCPALSWSREGAAEAREGAWGPNASQQALSSTPCAPTLGDPGISNSRASW